MLLKAAALLALTSSTIALPHPRKGDGGTTSTTPKAVPDHANSKAATTSSSTAQKGGKYGAAAGAGGGAASVAGGVIEIELGQIPIENYLRRPGQAAAGSSKSANNAVGGLGTGSSAGAGPSGTSQQGSNVKTANASKGKTNASGAIKGKGKANAKRSPMMFASRGGRRMIPVRDSRKATPAPPTAPFDMELADLLMRNSQFYAGLWHETDLFHMLVDTGSANTFVRGDLLPAEYIQESKKYWGDIRYFETEHSRLMPGGLSFNSVVGRVHYSGKMYQDNIQIARNFNIDNMPATDHDDPDVERIWFRGFPLGVVNSITEPPGRDGLTFLNPMDGVLGLAIDYWGSTVTPNKQRSFIGSASAGNFKIVDHSIFTIDLYRHDDPRNRKSKLTIGKCACEGGRPHDPSGWTQVIQTNSGSYTLPWKQAEPGAHVESLLGALDTGAPYFLVNDRAMIRYYTKLRAAGINWQTFGPLFGNLDKKRWWYCDDSKKLPDFEFNYGGKEIKIPGEQMIHSRGYVDPEKFAHPGMDGDKEVCVGSLQSPAMEKPDGYRGVAMGVPFFWSYTVCFGQGEGAPFSQTTRPPRVTWCPKPRGPSFPQKTPSPPIFRWGASVHKQFRNGAKKFTSMDGTWPPPDPRTHGAIQHWNAPLSPTPPPETPPSPISSISSGYTDLPATPPEPASGSPQPASESPTSEESVEGEITGNNPWQYATYYHRRPGSVSHSPEPDPKAIEGPPTSPPSDDNSGWQLVTTKKRPHPGGKEGNEPKRPNYGGRQPPPPGAGGVYA